MDRDSRLRSWYDCVVFSLVRTFFTGVLLAEFFAAFFLLQRGQAATPLPGRVTFGFGGSDQEVTESFDALFPLYAPKEGLLFFNPKITTSDQVDPRVSLGLGYRQLFEQSQVILGANIFYDNYDTVNDDRINQLGLGAEMLTRWVDLRGNLYLPDQKRYRIDHRQTVSTSRTSSSSTQIIGPQIISQTLGYQGYDVTQTTNGVNVSRTITSSQEIQTTRFFDRYEAGMLGGDVEAGVLLPWLDRYADVRIFGGYYWFDDQFGKTVRGPQSRLEVRALPALTFDAMYYANKEIIGSHWFFGVRVGVPFDLANIAEGRSPFAGFWESFKPKTKEEHPSFASRITENVIRTSRVSTSRSKLVNVGTSQKVVSSGTTTQETAIPFSQTIVLTLGGAPITVTHVDSAATSSGNGTFEAPYQTLTLAATDAIQRNIVLLHAGSVFNAQSIKLAQGQQLLGDASGITHLITTDQLGTIALPHATTGTVLPTLNNPGGTVVTLADNVQVSGLNFTNSARGIAGSPGASNVTISDSTFSNMTVAAIQISPSINTTLNRLTFQNNFKDVILDAANTTITNVTSTGAANGAILLADTTGITTLTNISINGAGGYGLRFTNPGGTHNITSLKITGGTGDGVDIQGGAGAFVFDPTSSITRTAGTAFDINGGASNVSFGGTIVSSATGRSVQVQNHTGGAVSFSGSVTDTGLGINLANNTGGSIVFSGPSQTLNTGANTALTLSANNGASISFSNLDITTTTGTGVAASGANSSITLSGANKPGPGAPAFTFTNTSGTYDYSGLTSSQSNIALAFNNTQTGTYNLGSLTILSAPGAAAFSGNATGANITFANLTVTNAAGIGLDLTNDTGSFAITGATTINTTGGDAIHLLGVAGTFAFGSVNISSAGQDGINLSGLRGNQNVTFGTTVINRFGSGNIAINFTGADVSAAFGRTTIQNNGAGTGIDLSSTQNGRVITFLTGSSITGVATGVQLGATALTTANALFTFGDGSGVDANGTNSKINATTTVAALGLNPALGNYNFQDVAFTGNPAFPTAPGALFVSSTAVNGVGNGTFANPYSVSDANAISTPNVTFAFLDGSYNFATLNGGAAFTLSPNQSVTGLDNGHTVSFGTTQPANVLGNFGVLGGTAKRTSSLSITNGTSNAAVFDLLGSDTIANITVTGSGGANNPGILFSSNGGSAGFNNAGGITLNGVTVSNLQTGSTAFNFTNMTGSVSIQGNNINTSAGTLLSISGGNANYTIVKGALPNPGATTGTLASTAITVQNTAGGSVQLTGATLNTTGNTAVTLNGNGATVTLTNLAATRTAGDTGFNIDATTPSTGIVTINGTSTLDNTAGAAFLIGAGARNINASALNFVNSGTTTVNVIQSTGQTGGSISFGNVGITGFNNATGTAVSLAGTSGTVGFGSLDITTTAGAGLNVGGIIFAPGSSATINAAGANALTLNGTTLSGGAATFSIVKSSGGVNGISLANVTGATTFSTVAITGSSGDGISLNNAGTVVINGGTVNGTTLDGIRSTNTNLALSGLTLGGAFAIGTNAIEVANSSGSSTLAINNTTVTNATGTGILVNGAGSTTTITALSGDTVSKAGAGGMTFDTVTFDADPVTPGIQQVAGGNTTIGNSLVTTNIAGDGLRLNNVLGNLAFGTLNIFNDTGTGLFIRTAGGKGGSFAFGNTGGTINTTNGAAMDVDPVALNSTFTAVSSTNAAGAGINLNTVTGTLNLGNVSVTNATTTGLVLVNSSAAVTASAVTINGAVTGLQFGTNSGGSFTATGATNLTNITTTGVNANGATGTYTFNGLTIGFAGAVANSRGLDFRSSDLQFQTGNLTITGNGTPTSIAIDLSGSGNPNGANSATPNILLATGTGQTAAISNVNIGVELGDTTVGTAGAYLRYGNQTPITSGGSGSSIAVIAGGVTVDTTNLTSINGFTQGRYEFNGVAFTGQATFEGATTGFIFVGSTSAGNDSGTNPANRINVAQLLTLDATPANLNNKTVVFVNDGSINFGASTFTLGAGTAIDGFGNGHSVLVPGATMPANVIGDTFVVAGGTFTDPNGAATLTANPSVNVLTLASGNTVQNININGGNNQIVGNGIAGFALNGVVQTNAGASAISLTNTTGTIAMTGGSISGAAGNAFVIDGGNSLVSYSGGITNSAAHSVVVQNRIGGSVTLTGTINDTGTGILVQNNTGGTTTFSGTGNTLNTGANQAVTLTNNTGATADFTGGNLAITTTSATGFGASGGGTVSVTGTGNTITSGTGTALGLNGVTIGNSGFVLQSVSANGAAHGIALNNLTGGGTVGVQITGTGTTAGSGGTIQNTTGAAVSLTNLASLGGGVTLDNVSISGNGGISGITFGTLNVANTSVSVSGAAALNLTTGTVAGAFSTLTSSGSTASGINLDTISGTLNLGNVNVTNAATTGLVLVNSSAAVTAGTVTVNGAPTGLQFGANTGSFTVTGATNLTNITTTGINANGATGSYGFSSLSIGFTGTVANSRGIDFRSSDLQFQTGNLSITGNGTPTSIGVDLSGSLYPAGQPVTANAPNILFATATGQTAVIGNVETGVKLGDTTVGTAGAYLRYGNQTPIGSGGSGSSIAVISGGVTIDTTNLTSTNGFTQGRYEFTGVTYTGHATFEQGPNPNFIFVGSNSAGSDNGSNPANRINVAQLLTLDGTPSNLNNKTVVFVNDGSINFGATTLTLGTGTIIDGFGNNHTVVVPGAPQPVNVIGDTFVLGGGSFTDPNGAATLTANAAVNVLTLSSGNTVQNININGGNNQIIGSGTAGFTLSGVVQTNAAASAINLTNATGAIAMTGGSISGAAGNAFVIDGGNSLVSYSGSITNSVANSVVVQNRTGGSVTLSGTINDTGTGILVQNNTGGTTTFSGTGNTLSTGTNQAVTLTNNTGATTSFTGGNLAITTTSATGFGASGGGTVSVTGTGNTITSGTGTALSLNGVTIGSSGFVLQSVSANGAANGIALNNLTGGGTVGVQVTGTGTTAGSGGTIQNTTGAAVSLTSLASLGGGVTLNNMNITGGGGLLGTNFGTLSVTNDSVSATGAPALSLTTGTVTAGSTFSTLSSSGSATNGVLLSGVSGSFTANAGAITGATAAAWSVAGGTVGVTYSGNITQANNAALLSVSGGHTGTLTFQTGTLSATNGTGLQFNNADGTYNFNGTTTLNGGNAAIGILTGSSGTFTFSNNTSITNPTGTAFVANGSSANVTYSGNITKSGTSAGLIVDITNESAGTITFQTGTLTSSSSAGTGINLSSANGTVNFNGTTTLNAGNAHVDINTGSSGTILFGSGASIGATTSPTGTAFNENTSTANVTYNGTIRQTNAVNGVSINAETGGTTTFGGAITANTTTANGINLTGNTGATVNFTGGSLAISTTTGVGFNATGGGTISVQGSGNTITSPSAIALNVANTTISSSGLTFLSVSAGNNTAAPEPVSGIVLNTTGASGGLTVTGDGSTSSGGDNSGGIIQNTTGVGIALTNTLSPSFTNMNIQSTGRSGIAGTGVTNFTFKNGTINNSGTAAVAGDADANIAFNSTSFTGAQTKNGNNINGTLTITGNVLSNGFSAGLDIQSDAGTVTNANVSNNTVSNPGAGTAGLSFVGTGNASTSFSLDNATINQNTVTNGASGGIQISISNNTATGPRATAGIPGNSADIIAITNNSVSLKTTGTNAIIFSTSGGNSASRTQANFIISGNGRTAAQGGTAPGSLGSSSIGTVIVTGNNGFSTMTGVVDHNVITATHTPNLGGGNGIAGGNGVAGAGNAWTPDLTLSVTNNTISGTDGNGILLVGRGTTGIARFKIANNNVGTPVNAGGTAREGIRVDAGNASSANDQVYLNIFGNTSAGSNGAGGIGIRKQGTNAAVNVFGIFDSGTLPGSPLTSPPTNANVMNFINANNPNGNGTDIISGSGFVRDTTQAPP
jgi:hypothetical protein